MAPGIELQFGLARRTASNTQQRHKSLIEMMAPGKLLPGDIYSILERTKKVYEDSNPRESGGHPLRRARDLYSMASLGLEHDESVKDWQPNVDEGGFYGDSKNIPIHTRQAIVAMQTRDPEGKAKLDAVHALSETTRHFKSIESELKKFYVDATTANSHVDSPVGREKLEAMNQRYVGGGYRFPKKIEREDMNAFLNRVHDDLTGSIIAVATDSAVFNYEGVKQLKDASEKKKSEFRAAVEKNRQAYSTLSKLELQDYLPSSIIEQRENDMVARGDSRKTEHRARVTASASFGATNDTGELDDFLKVNVVGPRYTVFGDFRDIDQDANINGLRLGHLRVFTVTGSEGGHVHTGLKKLSNKFDDAECRGLMEDIQRSTPLDIFFGKNGSGFEYQIWIPDTSTLDGKNDVVRAMARQTKMEFKSKNIDIAPLEDVMRIFTGLPFVVAPATKYAQEEKIAVESKIGGVPSEAILALNKAGGNFGVKATGAMHSFEKINENLKSEESQVHLNSFFSDLNAIPKIVHLFQVAALNESDAPYNDFHNLLYGYGQKGKNVRNSTAAAAHYSPTSKADPFNTPPIDRDLYQGLIEDAKNADWPAYDPELVSRLEQMNPEEQLDFYTKNPQGQKILQKFWEVGNTANLHLSVLKGADEIGYTLVPHKQLIKKLPVMDEKNPAASEKNILQKIGTNVAEIFTGRAGFRAVPMPHTAVHGDRKAPFFSTRMTFPHVLEPVNEEPSSGFSASNGADLQAPAPDLHVVASPASSPGVSQSSLQSPPTSDSTGDSHVQSTSLSLGNVPADAASLTLTLPQGQPSQKMAGHVDVPASTQVVLTPAVDRADASSLHLQDASANLVVHAVETTASPLAVPQHGSVALDTPPSLPVGTGENVVPTSGYQQLQPSEQLSTGSMNSTHGSPPQLPGAVSVNATPPAQPNGFPPVAVNTSSGVVQSTFTATTPPPDSVHNGSTVQPQIQQGQTPLPLGSLLGTGMAPAFDPLKYQPLTMPSDSMPNAPVTGLPSLVTYF